MRKYHNNYVSQNRPISLQFIFLMVSLKICSFAGLQKILRAFFPSLILALHCSEQLWSGVRPFFLKTENRPMLELLFSNYLSKLTKMQDFDIPGACIHCSPPLFIYFTDIQDIFKQ